MTTHEAHIFPFVNDRKYHIILKARIEAIGYTNWEIVVVIVGKTTLFEIWVAEYALIEVRQLGYGQHIINLLWLHAQNKLQWSQLQLAEIFLKVMAAKIDDIQVLHWDNREWGETPADFGNK